MPTVVPSAGAENHVTTYERDNGSTVRECYYAGAVRVALGTGGQTYYLLGDHLGSTAITVDGTIGNRVTELR